MTERSNTPRKSEALKAWGDDVALRGPDAPKSDGSIKHLIEYLLTVYERFGNTSVTYKGIQWGATALWKSDEQAKRIEELEGQLSAMPSETACSETSPHGLWVVWYEDPAKDHEVFFGDGSEAAARARYKSAYDNWSCHLLRRVPHGK